MPLKKYMTPEQLEAALIKSEAEIAGLKKVVKKLASVKGTGKGKSSWDKFLFGDEDSAEPILDETVEQDDPTEDPPEEPPDDLTEE